MAAVLVFDFDGTVLDTEWPAYRAAAELWAEFKTAMRGTDISRWLYNQGSATADRPGDLGYFIGYRIAEAFYARTVNKREALRAIIDVSNSDLFLSQSGYAP